LDVKALSDEATSAEIGRLQEQNALLARLLESERMKSQKAKDQLISRISGLLGDFAAERDQSLREAFEEMHNKNLIGEGEMEKCGNENGERMVNVIRAGEDWSGSLTRRGGEGKRLRDGALKVGFHLISILEALMQILAWQALSSSQATFSSALVDVQSTIAGSSSTYRNDLRKQTESLDATCNDGRRPSGL
jgi:kinesin family protein 11